MILLAAAYPGLNGFIPGSRASLMFDVVFVAMFAIVPVLLWSVYLVKYRRNYGLHKRVQLWLGGVLLVAITAFEIDVRSTSWRERAAPSPYYESGEGLGAVDLSLFVHLFFAIPTALLWIIVIVRALRNFPASARPSAHSRWHRRWGMVATIEMVMTAVTGWIFYWLAFLAN